MKKTNLPHRAFRKPLLVLALLASSAGCVDIPPPGIGLLDPLPAEPTFAVVSTDSVWASTSIAATVRWSSLMRM